MRRGPTLTLAGYSTSPRVLAPLSLPSEIVLRPDAEHLDVPVTVENQRPAPLELMYLAHVNFRPVDGAPARHDAGG